MLFALKVTGDTVFNVLKIGEEEVENERPLFPVTIQRVDVVLNPFIDIVPRPNIARKAATEEQPQRTVAQHPSEKRYFML
jgi:peptidyl-prolyl cis-trans isomerase SDCCAG10